MPSMSERFTPHQAGVDPHMPEREAAGEGKEAPLATSAIEMATFIPVQFTEFCQPDATMPFGKELVQITKNLRIALPTITGKPTSSYPEVSRYRIEVHVPGRTFEPRTEPVDFKFIAPN
ncbi:hypothetical protein D1007_55133 [Hordeum vulgare]|nr:hypothetical protein D1007_55133 [Hordeum vulgare]